MTRHASTPTPKLQPPNRDASKYLGGKRATTGQLAATFTDLLEPIALGVGSWRLGVDELSPMKPATDHHPQLTADAAPRSSASRVYDVAHETPLDQHRLSQRLRNDVLLKREDLQPVFSHKLRGAQPHVAPHRDERARGVIVAPAPATMHRAWRLAASRPQRLDRDAEDDAGNHTTPSVRSAPRSC